MQVGSIQCIAIDWRVPKKSQLWLDFVHAWCSGGIVPGSYNRTMYGVLIL